MCGVASGGESDLCTRAQLADLNTCLRNDLKQRGVHQPRIVLQGSLSSVSLFSGRKVLQAMKCHQVAERGTTGTVLVDSIKWGEGGLH